MIIIGGIILSLLVIFFFNHKNNIRKNLFHLFLQLNLSIKNDKEVVLPKYKFIKNQLIFYKYNPLITKNSFNPESFEALSNQFCKDDKFIFCDYKKSNFFERIFLNYNNHKLVFYSSDLPTKNYFKDRPILKPFEFWVGTDVFGNDLKYSMINRQGISIHGLSGYGKTSLSTIIGCSLDSSVKKEIIFTKNTNDFLSGGKKTIFIPKDDENKILETLKSLKEEAIKKQIQLQEEGFQNIYEKNEKLVLLVFDEAHSYMSQLKSSSDKEKRNTRNEIIEIANWFQNQARSVGYICMYILPSLEKEAIDVDIRSSAFIFSTKIASETVSMNVFGSPIATLLPSDKKGLFVSKDQTVFQAPIIEWKR